MSDLTNQKIKDAFPSLLTLSSNDVTGSAKAVQDGNGTDTALALSTGTVNIDGTLVFDTVPATGSTEVKCLLLNASNQVVERTLDTTAFTGLAGAITTASTPLVKAGSNVTMLASTSLSQLTSATIANADDILIYDISTSTWKRINAADLKSFINPTPQYVAPQVAARRGLLGIASIGTTFVRVAFAPVGAQDNETIELGIPGSIALNGGNNGIDISTDGTYQFDVAVETDNASTNLDVFVELRIAGSVGRLVSAKRTGGTDPNTMSFYTTATLTAGDTVDLYVKTSTGTIEITENTQLYARKLN